MSEEGGRAMFPVVLRIAIFVGVLAAIYIALDSYMKWDRKRRLIAEHSNGDDDALTREDYVARGLAKYERSWERKLLYGVFIVPIVAALLIALLAHLG
jgi:hypothetical protein